MAVLGLFLCEGPLQLRQVGATLHRGARASHYRGLSCCGAQAPGRGGVDSDLCLHTGFLVAAAAALASHARLWGPH